MIVRGGTVNRGGVRLWPGHGRSGPARKSLKTLLGTLPYNCSICPSLYLNFTVHKYKVGWFTRRNKRVVGCDVGRKTKIMGTHVERISQRILNTNSPDTNAKCLCKLRKGIGWAGSLPGRSEVRLDRSLLDMPSTV